MFKDQNLLDSSLKCLGTDNEWTFTETGFMTEAAWEKVVKPDYIQQVKAMRKALGKEVD